MSGFGKKASSGIKDISVRDQDGIEQFKVDEFIEFENFDYNIAEKKVIGAKLPYNTFIGGMSAVITSKAVLGTYLISEATNILFNTAEIDEFIKNFTIVAGEIRVSILADYRLINSAFRGGTSGEVCTYYHDLDGRMKKHNFQTFINNTNLTSVIFPESKDSPENVYANNIALVKAILPKEKIIDFDNSGLLSEFDFSNAEILKFINSTITIPEFNDFSFPKARVLIGLGFRQAILNDVELNNLDLVELNCFNGNTNLTSFKSRNLKKMESSVFRNCSNLQFVDIPNCESIGDDVNNGISCFWSTTALQYIYAPKCKVLGNDPSTVAGLFNASISGVIITLNEFLKTSNGGLPDPTIADAISKGATVIFASDTPQSFEDKAIDITTTYLDDAAAALGNIELGKRYIDNTGSIKVRLT